MKKTERDENLKMLNEAHELGIKLRTVHAMRGVVKWQDVERAAVMLSLLAGFGMALIPPAEDEGDTK